ncbi:MAG: hypothetical protein GY923_15265 [Aestuariibacter sp.]|nr:hypothetical protein [Aestuariibacter sp.]
MRNRVIEFILAIVVALVLVDVVWAMDDKKASYVGGLLLSFTEVCDGSCPTWDQVSGAGDLGIEKELEVDGIAYLDGGADLNEQNIANVGDVQLDTLTADGTHVRVNSHMQMEGNSLGLGSSHEVVMVQGSSDEYELWVNQTKRLTINPDGAQEHTAALTAATGDEYASDIAYTTNKASSGNDYGLRIVKTDTNSPGTSYMIRMLVGASQKFAVFDTGTMSINGALTAGSYIAGTNLSLSGGGLWSDSGVDLSLNAGGAGITEILDFTGIGDGTFVAKYIDVGQGDLLVEDDVEIQGDLFLDGGTWSAAGDIDTSGTLTVGPFEYCMTFAPAASVLGPTAPTATQCGNYSCLGFDAAGETAEISKEIPDELVGTTGTFKTYWTNTAGDAIANGETVKQDLNYSVTASGDLYDANTTEITNTYTESGNPGTDKQWREMSVAITGLAAGKFFGGIYNRDTGVDTYSGQCRVMQFELCINVDSIPNHN